MRTAAGLHVIEMCVKLQLVGEPRRTGKLGKARETGKLGEPRKTGKLREPRKTALLSVKIHFLTYV